MGKSYKRFWLVAAGTGGHILPGITLAKEIKARVPNAEILFFGTRDRLEAKLIPEAGFHISFLSAGRWKGTSPFAKVLGLLQLVLGFFQVVGKILHNGKPDCLIGVGGYVSLPVAFACLVFRVKLYLIEPNIKAGISNRLLSHWATESFSVPGSDAEKVFHSKVLNLGNPVRSEVKPSEIKPEANRILVLGGSQGAKKVCEAVLEVFAKIHRQHPHLHLTLQTGEANLQSSQALKETLGLNSEVGLQAFIRNVPEILKENDVVISRAGAMTLAELSISGLPTVLIPFPFAADDHQRVNAKLLADDNACLMVDEKDPQFLNKLEDNILKLVSGSENFSLRKKLNTQFQKWARPQACKDITDRLLKNG